MFGLKASSKAQEKLKELQELHEKAKRFTQFTPDLPNLNKRQYHMVFLYDGHMRSHPFHHQIPGATFRGVAFTKYPFALWRINDSDIREPVALPNSFSTTVSAPVKGEIFQVDNNGLIFLDNDKENGTMFQRKKVQLNVFHRPVLFEKEPKKVYIETRPEDSREIFDNQVKTLGPQQVKQVSAWMYVGVPDFWEPELDGGYNFKPVRLFESKKDQTRYYYHSIMEYNDDQ